MIFERISLWPGSEDVYLDVYVADALPNFTRKAILVIPGGGYGRVCCDREGEPIAMAFMPYGYNAFVLHYSVARSRTFPDQLIEASAAMKHIRDNAARYNIDPEQVFVIGFSAGAHLAGTLGTLWHMPEIYETIPMPEGYNKPTGMLLIYPVISGDPAISHPGSFCNLFGTDTPTAEQLEAASLDKLVDERSAPVFLMHTANDQVVPIENSLRMAMAYRRAGRTFELHVYPDGPHGMALANPITGGCFTDPRAINAHCATWVENAVRWAEQL